MRRTKRIGEGQLKKLRSENKKSGVRGHGSFAVLAGQKIQKPCPFSDGACLLFPLFEQLGGQQIGAEEGRQRDHESR